MLKIATCDDNIEELQTISGMLRDYKDINKTIFETEILSFDNAIDLIAAIESGIKLDIIILDIIMPAITGMDAAREIRTIDDTVKIIFLTSSPEFAVDSYDVGAFYYTMKPIWKEKLFVLIDKAVAELKLCQDESLIIKAETGLTRVPLHLIEYIEVIGRKIFYHKTDKTVLEAGGTMNETESSLSGYPQFVKAHRSFLVNIAYIDRLTAREIKMMSGNIIPLPKANYSSLKEKYLDWSFHGVSTHE